MLRHRLPHFADFGMDTISLSGTLDIKLNAMNCNAATQACVDECAWGCLDLVGHKLSKKDSTVAECNAALSNC